jgi:hypothetical protein
VVQLVKESIARFEERATAVERKFCGTDNLSINGASNTEPLRMSEKGKELAGQQNVSDQVRKFVESCNCIITGSLSWR